MLTMVRGWLERGVDGFRLDVFNAFFKDEQLLSNPRRFRGRRPYDRQVHLYDKDRPELAGFLEEFRALVDSFPQRMTVGELFSGDPALAPKLSAPRHLVFDFELIRTHRDAEGMADDRAFEPRPVTPGVALGTGRRRGDERRDRPRSRCPFADDARHAVPLL